MDPVDLNDNSSVDDPADLGLSQAESEQVKDSDTLLIETVYAYPALYDKALKDYHIVDIRQNCWAMVSAVMNKSVPECQKRWTQLRDSFTNEKRRRNKDQRSGSGPTKRKGFALYNSMDFLHGHVKQKKTFTNISLTPSLATSSAISPHQMNMLRELQAYPLPRQPVPMSTVTFPIVPDMLGTNFQSGEDLFSSFPPTPESNPSTPLPTSSTPTTTPPPTSIPPPAKRICSSFQGSAPDSEARVTPTKPSASNSTEGSFTCNRATCTERSGKSGFSDFNVPASTPPPRTPTPRSTLMSPESPYSSCSDVSGSFSMDDTSQFTTAKTMIPPTSCYTKDVRKAKKVDPVEKSFLSLSSVIQDHFAQKTVVKQPVVNNMTASSAEDSFGILVAQELQKLDEQTKKQKKARILQILYE